MEHNEQLMRRIELLEQANAALNARNRMLEVKKDSGTLKEVDEEVKSRLSKQKDRGSITVVKNELPSEFTTRAE